MAYMGPFPITLADGGSNAALVASNGGIVYSGASAFGILGATATAHQILLSGASTAPLWSTTTFPTSTTLSGILYASSANVVGQIAVVNNGVLISSNTGVPSLLANSGTAGFVLTANSGAPPSWQVLPSSSISITGDSGGAQTGAAFTFTGTGSGLTFAGVTGTFTLGGTLNLTHGGTNASLTASNGGIFYSTATAGAILSGTATASQVLLSGSTAAPAWSTATYPATVTANNILFASASNVIGQIATANDGVLITSNSGVPSLLANSGTPGFVLTANSAAPPSWQAAPVSVMPVTLISVTDSPYSALVANEFIGVDSSGGAVTVLLPNAPVTGKIYSIKDSTGSAVAHNITVSTVGGAVLIDGATSFVMASAFQAISVVFDGTTYQIY